MAWGQGAGRAGAASGQPSPHRLAQPLCLGKEEGSGGAFRSPGLGGLQAFPQLSHGRAQKVPCMLVHSVTSCSELN